MALDSVQFDIDTTKAAKKLYKLEKKLQEGATLAANEIGELGKNYARSIAPYYSGKTFRLIKLMNANRDGEAIIVAQNPTANDGHYRRIANFDLVRWMHQTGGRGHIKSGDPRFMYTTRDYLQTVAPVRVRARYNRIVAEINNT